jgi:hypothetical protein
MKSIVALLRELVNKLAYEVKRDPLYLLMEKAIKSLQSNDFKASAEFLRQSSLPIKSRVQWYVINPQLKAVYSDIEKTHKAVTEMVIKSQEPGIKEKALAGLSEIKSNLEKAEPMVKNIDKKQL